MKPDSVKPEDYTHDASKFAFVRKRQEIMRLQKSGTLNERQGDIVNNTYYFSKKLNFQNVIPD